MPLADFRKELQDASGAAQPVSEGLGDYLAVNLLPEARARVQGLFASYQQRLQAINDVIGALDRLEATGYPADIRDSVDQPVLDDLKAQADTIAAALAKFSVAPAPAPAPEPVADAPELDKASKRK